ncbi:endonuclease/exonuclease/phosphatase family protein [Gluconacetobacter diazotrophicus]|uniref:Endonuclease/exonuclease/phosphatase family protein n=1 Tax=Gluconacetobacter diazotrophicus TaxID=33996 RepID=A0A7W4FBU0_GLUDI|nr:endonuclease/exonuclease/phosphatase family protein [Gluconacetobacter diazotrophicus]MBB2154875.1 endonuclease/exonuclease/phosphatase family protein [Gluconacetobacter diazotrophicus]
MRNVLRQWACAGLVAVALAHPAAGRTIKVSTWNLDWLTARAAGDPTLPPDVHPRADADLRRLAVYAARLDADIVGFQEVDSPALAARLFPPGRYRIVMTADPVVQRTGLAVATSLTIERHPDLAALDVYPPTAPHPLRSGLDVTIGDGTANLRVLVVHLKAGCRDAAPSDRRAACLTLARQMAVLDDWVAQRHDEGVPFLVMGDFNRNLTPGDPFFHLLDQDGPLTLATAGRASPCWGGTYFIDHLLLGNQARGWLRPDSLRVLTYDEQDPARAPALSDHCPVSVRLEMP